MQGVTIRIEHRIWWGIGEWETMTEVQALLLQIKEAEAMTAH